MQLGAPAELRGRVMSLHSLLQIGTTPLGSLTVGFVSESFGVGPALVTCSVFCALGLVLALFFARRKPKPLAVVAQHEPVG